MPSRSDRGGVAAASTAKKKQKKTAGHGGPRPGAGRPVEGSGRSRPRSVSLTDAEFDALKAAGDGSATAGVRRLLEAHG